MIAWRQKGAYGPICGMGFLSSAEASCYHTAGQQRGAGERLGRADVKCWLASTSFMLNVQLALSSCWHELQDKAFRKRKCSSSDIEVEVSRQVMVKALGLFSQIC